MADALIEHCDYIVNHNVMDMEEANANNLSKDILDRLSVKRRESVFKLWLRSD